MSIFGPELFDAAEKGDTDILEWLVKSAVESDINYRRPSRNNLTNTPICVAVSKGHTHAAAIILSNPHVNINANVPDNIYGWALGWACQQSDGAELIRLIASHPTVDLNRQDLCGRTVLMVAAASAQGLSNVRALLQYDGIKTALKNNLGQTAVDLAENDEIKHLIKSYARGTVITSPPVLPLPATVRAALPAPEEYLQLLEQIRCARFYGIWLKKTEELSRSKNTALAAEQMIQAALFGQRIDQFRRICVDTPELQALTAAEFHMLPDRVAEMIEDMKEECRTLAKKENYVEMERVGTRLSTLKLKFRTLPRQLTQEARDSPPLSPAAVASLQQENESLRHSNLSLKTAVNELHGAVADLTIKLRALQKEGPHTPGSPDTPESTQPTVSDLDSCKSASLFQLSSADSRSLF
eukprot:Colp12_sorted_trinity150504_noHs@8561